VEHHARGLALDTTPKQLEISIFSPSKLENEFRQHPGSTLSRSCLQNAAS